MVSLSMTRRQPGQSLRPGALVGLVIAALAIASVSGSLAGPDESEPAVSQVKEIVTEMDRAPAIAPVAMKDGPAVFPRISAQNLAGRTYSLPGDFGSGYTLVSVAFRTHRQVESYGWERPIKEAQRRRPTLSYFDFVIAGQGRLANYLLRQDWSAATRAASSARERSFAVGGGDARLLRDALDIGDREDFVLLLTDARGQIHWSITGRATRANQAALSAALNRFLGGTIGVSYEL